MLFKALPANALALLAIALWASLAVLGVSLSHVPPFLLTGVALLVGSLVALPLIWRKTSQDKTSLGTASGIASGFDWQQLKVAPSALALGVYGLFGFHFLLFVALRHAPPVQANLVNYLWPLGIVVMAPLFIRGAQLTAMHLIAACAGFTGASIAIVGDKVLQNGWSGIVQDGFAWGYIPALCSAFIWASYSLGTKRLFDTGRGFSTAAIGVFGLVSGLLSLLCHVFMEASAVLTPRDWLLLIVMGLGPLGSAFYLWDAALKKGNALQIGILSYITPLVSTALLMVFTGKAFTASIAAATALIVGAALLATRAR